MKVHVYKESIRIVLELRASIKRHVAPIDQEKQNAAIGPEKRVMNNEPIVGNGMLIRQMF